MKNVGEKGFEALSQPQRVSKKAKARVKKRCCRCGQVRMQDPWWIRLCVKKIGRFICYPCWKASRTEGIAAALAVEERRKKMGKKT